MTNKETLERLYAMHECMKANLECKKHSGNEKEAERISADAEAIEAGINAMRFAVDYDLTADILESINKLFSNDASIYESMTNIAKAGTATNNAVVEVFRILHEMEERLSEIERGNNDSKRAN